MKLLFYVKLNYLELINLPYKTILKLSNVVSLCYKNVYIFPQFLNYFTLKIKICTLFTIDMFNFKSDVVYFFKNVYESISYIVPTVNYVFPVG